MRRGFTLIELMIASSISVLVIGGVLTAFTGLQRLLRDGYATAELSIRMREIREKLLFHAAPAHDGKCYPGVLSGRPVSTLPVEGNAKIYVSTYATKANDGSYVESKIQLVTTELQGGGARFQNDAESAEYLRMRWFSLGDVAYLGSSPFDVTRLSSQANLSQNLYFVNLDATIGHVRRRERVAIPVFGLEQKKGTSNVFHDTVTGGGH